VDYLDVSQRNLIELDDLMAHSGKDKRIVWSFYERKSSQKFLVIFVVQNVFHQGKEMRKISFNAHYILLFMQVTER
jgi:hypothetical protein